MNKTLDQIDLRGIPCPRNTAKALLFLEALEDNSLALIIIDDGEPVQNFLESLEIEIGYAVKEKMKIDNYWHLHVFKEESA